MHVSLSQGSWIIKGLKTDCDSATNPNRNRLGVRLEGPAPKWARTDGGEGGSHPSNVHDHVYAIGTINFTGNTVGPTGDLDQINQKSSQRLPACWSGCLRHNRF